MVKKLSENLKIPVCCKIRILPDEEDTLELCKQIEKAGCSILTVHGRTKEQNKHKIGNCDWQIIKKIKENANIPVFANGGIYRFEDVEACFKETGVDGVMSAEGLLENPALFSGPELKDLDVLAAEYLEFWEKYDGKNKRYLKPHLFKILHQGLKENTDLRSRLGAAKSFEDQKIVAEELALRRKDMDLDKKFGWYHRYRFYKKPEEGGKKVNKIDVKGKLKVEVSKAEKEEIVEDGEAQLGKRVSPEGEE